MINEKIKIYGIDVENFKIYEGISEGRDLDNKIILRCKTGRRSGDFKIVNISDTNCFDSNQAANSSLRSRIFTKINFHKSEVLKYKGQLKAVGTKKKRFVNEHKIY